MSCTGNPPSAAAADRNKEPILAVLRDLLPARGRVLEIASGTGQHIVHFAAALPGLQWQPTDADPSTLDVMHARIEAARLPSIAPPTRLDVHDDPWPISGTVSAILCINMIHIAPGSALQALVRGAARVLANSPDGLLFLYGPFREGGRHTSRSNEEFDASLRRRDAVWGVRNLEDVDSIASGNGFSRTTLVRMPANNLSLVYTLHHVTVNEDGDAQRRVQY